MCSLLSWEKDTGYLAKSYQLVVFEGVDLIHVRKKIKERKSEGKKCTWII